MTQNIVHKNLAQIAAEKVIFNVRWLLSPFYIGLVIVLVLYLFVYAKEILDICVHFQSLKVSDMELVALDMVDIVMIANLIKMIITGSWNSFVSKDHGYKNENVSSGTLKNKIMTSIVVVSTLHLLKIYVQPSVNWELLTKQLLIYGMFLFGSLALGILDYLHVKSEVLEHEKDTSSH